MFKLKLKKRESKKKKKAPSDGVAARAALVQAVPLLIALFIAGSLLAAFSAAFINSGYFTLKSIETVGAGALASFNELVDDFFKTYRSRPIFSIDLRVLSARIAARYPDAREIFVRRKFPDRLSIAIALRRPIALINDEKYYPVDREGVVLLNANPALWQKLPIITGVGVSGRDTTDARTPSGGLRTAIDLIAAIEKVKAFADYAVTAIDVSDPKNVSFFLEDGLEIKIGHENFKERLQRLAHTLKNPKLVVSRIKYIDLRFKDMVIGQK